MPTLDRCVSRKRAAFLHLVGAAARRTELICTWQSSPQWTTVSATNSQQDLDPGSKRGPSERARAIGMLHSKRIRAMILCATATVFLSAGASSTSPLPFFKSAGSGVLIALSFILRCRCIAHHHARGFVSAIIMIYRESLTPLDGVARPTIDDAKVASEMSPRRVLASFRILA